MLDIRITVNQDQFSKVFEIFDKMWEDRTYTDILTQHHIICVHEGEPYDVGIKSHLHVYCSFNNKSESWLRKALQSIDKTRKGNQLYSMKKSHFNSPNYVLKKVFEKDRDLNDPRIVYNKGNIPWEEYRNRYDSYMQQISKKEQRNEKEAKFKKITDYVLKNLDTSEYRVIQNIITDIIELVLKYCTDEGYAMPSKSQMEIYVLTVINQFQSMRNYLIEYYSFSLIKNFSHPQY